MEKQDILEKSRREKTDEGVTYAENAGRRYGMIAFCLLNSAVILYNLVKGLDSYLPWPCSGGTWPPRAWVSTRRGGSASTSGWSCAEPSPPCASCSAMCCGPGERGREFG